MVFGKRRAKEEDEFVAGFVPSKTHGSHKVQTLQNFEQCCHVTYDVLQSLARSA